MDNEIHTCRINKYNSIGEIPADWDVLAEVYFQKKAFLDYCERYNPCKQRYYIYYNTSKAVAAAIVYTIPVDLFTFSNIHSPLRMHVIGPPVSISPPGIFGTKEGVDVLLQHILKTERGLILGLNLTPDTNTGKGLKLNMLPGVEMESSFNNWGAYLHQLRSTYRRRCMHITEKWKNISTLQTSCTAFSDQHYQLYKDVLKHSSTKLETIPKEYFQNLPENFYLATSYKDDNMLCWHINCSDKGENKLYFFFGGHNYQFILNEEVYFNNLFGILKESIEKGFPQIDLGQTAEIPKMKVGGIIVPKVMFLYHHNTFILFLIKCFKGLIEYKRRLPAFHVFRKKMLSSQ